MRIQVQITDEYLTLHCQTEESVASVSKRALEKLKKLKPNFLEKIGECEIKETRKTIGGCLLDPDDRVFDVVRDGEFIFIVLMSDVPEGKERHPILNSHPVSKVVHTPEDQLFHAYDEPAHWKEPVETLLIDGNSLTTYDLIKCGRGLVRLELGAGVDEKLKKTRRLLEDIVKDNKVVYGVTTGFGCFSNVCVSPEELADLQVNLIRSHAVGVGPPLPPSRVRMLLALRINVLTKGYSGIAPGTVHQMVDCFNGTLTPILPFLL